MYIKSLHVYGYGKIIDQYYDLEKELHVFYGKNEAGKSTILSFIHSVLFGFPTKVQTENRYEPKKGLKYGGIVIIQTDDQEIIKIERVSGKAVGDVKVYYEDGRTGNEQDLNVILYGMDKRIFTSIFSFGIKGLQDIHSIRTDDLSDYLFSSSVLGNDQVVELERKLNKDLDHLFKPGGKKPEINQQLDSLVTFSIKVNEAKKQLEQYQLLNEKEQNLERELTKVKNDSNTLYELIKKLDVFEQYLPYSREYNTIIEQLKKLQKHATFPIDGTNRLDMIMANLLPHEARKKGLLSHLEELDLKTSKITIHEALLQSEQKIKSLTVKSVSYDEDLQQLERLKTKEEILQREIQAGKQSLGIATSNEQLAQLNFTLSRKEEIRGNLKLFENAKQKKELLTSRQEHIHYQLQTSIDTINQYKDQLLPTEKKEELEKIVEKAKTPIIDQEATRNKMNRVSKQIHGYEKKVMNSKKLRNFVFLPLFFITAVLGVWDRLSSGQSSITYLVASILFLVAGMVVPLIVKNDSLVTMLKEEKFELNQLLQEVSQIENELVRNKDIIQAQQLLAKDDQIIQLMEKEEIVRSQLNKEAEKLINQLEEWEQQWYNIIKRLQALKEDLYIPAEYSYESLFDIYEHIQLIVSKITELRQIQRSIHDIQIRIVLFEQEYDSLLSKFDETVHLTLTELNEKVEEEKDKRKHFYSLLERKSDITKEIETLDNEILYYHDQLQTLFKAAGAKDEETFRETAVLHSEWVNLQNKKNALREKMQLIVKNDNTLEQEFFQQSLEFIEQLEKKEVIMKEYKLLEEREEEIRHSLAKVGLQKTELEQSGTYSSFVQEYESKKAEFRNIAKSWAKLSIAKDILNRTKNFYQHVRLPAVINKAEEYFSVLTKNQYVKLFAPQEHGSFIVERNDGTRFTPQELSQGTAEQLYLALRLALAENYHTPIKFPLFIDDGFVNFDEERTSITLELLKGISQNRQVVFFTCHKEVVEGLNVNDYTNLSSHVTTV